MRPGTIHFVLTVQDSLCHGGHFYSSQTMTDTGFAIFQSFVACSVLTNTTNVYAVVGLQRILAYWTEELMNLDGYALDLSDANSQECSDSMFFRLPYSLLFIYSFRLSHHTPLAKSLSPS